MQINSDAEKKKEELMQAPPRPSSERCVYRVPSKLDRCVLQSPAVGVSLGLFDDEPKPGMELNLCIFLRGVGASDGELWPKEDESEVGEAAPTLEEEWELYEEPVALGVWYTYSPST